MQIRKSSDFRVNELAELIEHLKDYKHHITPFEIAEEVVKYMDMVTGRGYMQKIKDHLEFNTTKDKV